MNTKTTGKPKATAKPAATPVTAKATTKLDQLIALLRRAKGATIEQMVEATGWQAHSVRGAMSGSLKKKQGLNIASEKTDAGRIYRIVEAA